MTTDRIPAAGRQSASGNVPPPGMYEVGFANNATDARDLAVELDGQVQRVSDRRGYVILRDVPRR